MAITNKEVRERMLSGKSLEVVVDTSSSSYEKDRNNPPYEGVLDEGVLDEGSVPPGPDYTYPVHHVKAPHLEYGYEKVNQCHIDWKEE